MAGPTWLLRKLFVSTPWNLWKNAKFVMATILFFAATLFAVAYIRFDPPRLRGEIAFIGMAPVTITSLSNPAAVTNEVGFILFVAIRNAGSPSIVDNWTLDVEVSSQRRITIENPDWVPLQSTLPSEITGNTPTVVCGSDSLIEKTVVNPLARGAAARGVVMFHTDRLRIFDARAATTNYTLRFSDIAGNHYSIPGGPGTPSDYAAMPGVKSGTWPGSTQSCTSQQTPATQQ